MLDMIKKITIRDVASYDHEGCTFEDLQKVNFIYGGNGTGKTTISRVLGEPLREQAYPHCELEWDGTPEQVIVYNKDFRENQLKEYMPGVFTLGQQWVDFDKRMDKRRLQREEIAKRMMAAHEWLVKLDNELKEAEEELQNKVWEKAYVPHQEFKECLKGYDKKASFLERIRREIALMESKNQSENVTYDQWSIGVNMNIGQIRFLYKDLYEGEYSKLGPDNSWTGKVVIERETLTASLWRFMAELVKTDVMWAEMNIKDIKHWQKERSEEYEAAMMSLSQIDSGLNSTDSMIRSQQPTIDRINRKLKMMKCTGFSIQPSPGMDRHYQIQREDGSFVKQTLSEGEATLISFLYFMELVKGRVMEMTMRMPVIVVIDDPISSLDRLTMYEVVTMVNQAIDEARCRRITKREVLEDSGIVLEYYDDPYETEDRENWIEQVIVLTHNTAFHKAVSDRQRRKDTKYWKLTKKKGVSKVKSYGTTNPVKGEYEELWENVRMAKRKLEEGKRVVGLPNVIRKIVEAYFVGFGGYDKRKLFAGAYVKDNEDRLEVVSLAKWFDERSHGAIDDAYAEGDEEMTEHYLEAFRLLFEKMGHEAHYKMMMREE